MNEQLNELISKLPSSPTSLDEATTKKIYSLIPVPSDYKILWADILSFGGYPAGVVITDRTLVIKASKEEVKNNKALISEQNKRKSVKKKVVPYRIILWDYYSPEDYDVIPVVDGKGNSRYILKAGEIEVARFGSKGLYTMLTLYKKKVVEAHEIVEATFSAIRAC